jgi:hypothetical protein
MTHKYKLPSTFARNVLELSFINHLTHTQCMQGVTWEMQSTCELSNHRSFSDVNRCWALIGRAVWLSLVCRLWSNQWHSYPDYLPVSMYLCIQHQRLCSLYAVPIDRSATGGRGTGWSCWLIWFVWFSMHCLSSGGGWAVQGGRSIG